MESQNPFPVIDCSNLLQSPDDGEHEDYDTEEFSSFVQQLGDALKNHGIGYFINHGIATEKVDRVIEMSKEFFDLPLQVKTQYKKIDPINNFWGYIPSNALDGTRSDGGCTKEAFDFCGPNFFNRSAYPVEVPELYDSIIDYRGSLKRLIKIILKAMAIYLNLDDGDSFINYHKAFLLEDSSVQAFDVVRSAYYPKLEKKLVDVEPFRLGGHSDHGTITFLHQDDIGGLEALLKEDREAWEPVVPIQDSIVFIGGITLEMLSGDTFWAAPHRVKTKPNNAIHGRQSLGFFLHPDGNSLRKPFITFKEIPDSESTANMTCTTYSKYMRTILTDAASESKTQLSQLSTDEFTKAIEKDVGLNEPADQSPSESEPTRSPPSLETNPDSLAPNPDSSSSDSQSQSTVLEPVVPSTHPEILPDNDPDETYQYLHRWCFD